MQWQYRTILFELHKDGLLGDRYIDDEEIEKILNEQGESGWELVNVTPIREGLLAFCKRPGKQLSGQRDSIIGNQERGRLTRNQQPTPLTAEQLQRQEREHIRRLELARRKAMRQQEQDNIGNIKIS